jgi:hypothetical protein
MLEIQLEVDCFVVTFLGNVEDLNQGICSTDKNLFSNQTWNLIEL